MRMDGRRLCEGRVRELHSPSSIVVAILNPPRHPHIRRFLHAGRHLCASVFAPISYPSLPLLAFKMPEEGDMSAAPRLVATGGLKSCDPDRVVLKKIVLTGE